MTEEKKENKADENISAQTPPDVNPAAKAPEEEVKKVEPATKPLDQTTAATKPPETAAAPSEPKAAETAKKPEVKKEKPSNCASCNKSIRKKQWYYRNGKFYCSKRCWKTTSKKDKTPEASQEPK